MECCWSFIKIGIRCTLTIDRGRRPGAAFSYKLQQYAQISLIFFCFWPKISYFRLARAKSHAIFSDGELNSERVVYLNIYQNLLLTAMKMHEYIRDWGVRGRKNTAFLRSEFQTSVHIYLLIIPYGRGHRTNDRLQLFDCSSSGAAERP